MNCYCFIFCSFSQFLERATWWTGYPQSKEHTDLIYMTYINCIASFLTRWSMLSVVYTNLNTFNSCSHWRMSWGFKDHGGLRLYNIWYRHDSSPLPPQWLSSSLHDYTTWIPSAITLRDVIFSISKVNKIVTGKNFFRDMQTK